MTPVFINLIVKCINTTLKLRAHVGVRDVRALEHCVTMAQEEAKSPAGKALNFADASRFSTRDEDEAAARGADIPVRIATAQRARRVMLSCLAGGQGAQSPAEVSPLCMCECVRCVALSAIPGCL